MKLFYLQLLTALVADLIIGDPRWLPHPVRLIGWFCVRYELACRSLQSAIPLRACGMLAFSLVLISSVGLSIVFLIGMLRMPFAAIVAVTLLLYFFIAAGDLIAHSRRVYNALRAGQLPEARLAVAMMVGRDTDRMNETQIARACIESVAENLVDGVTAPIFWALVASLAAYGLDIPAGICGAAGVVGYKAINTMDSMYGYRNERYLQFGWLAARVDDLFNFLPSRISGLCMVGAAFLCGEKGRASLAVLLRDRLKSSSPNSGHTEAAAAGAIGIQLGGTSSYFGSIVEKPVINDGAREPGPADILACNRLVLVATILFLSVTVGGHFILTQMIN